MKKLLLFIIILNSCFLTAQKIGADVLKFSGKVTSTVRDSFDVPTGESWLIWNVTTEQFEVGDDAETWGPLMGDGTGAVVSVNGKAGTVVLNPDDLSDASSTNKFITAALLAKLDGIETGAEVNVPSDWNAVSGDARILNKPTLGDLAAKDNVANTDIVGGGLNGQVLTTDGAGTVTWENPTSATIVNDLVSTDTDKSLSAAQGKVLQDSKGGLSTTNTWSGTNMFSIGLRVGTFIIQGQFDGVSDKRWMFGKNRTVIEGDFIFNRQDASETTTGGTYSTLYKLNASGTPTDPTDLTDKAYVDSVVGGGGTDDQTAAEVSVDASGFDGNLDTGDTDVQAALQKLDDLNISLGGGIVAEGSVDITTLTAVPVAGGSNTATVTVTHSLGYAPSATRISLQLSRPDEQSSANQVLTIGDITSTTFDVLIGSTSGHDLQLNWRIFGPDSETPLDFGEVASGLDTELGSSDWRTGGSGGIQLHPDSPVTIDSLYVGTPAEIEAAGLGATVLSIPVGADPSTVVTSATIDLNEFGIKYNDQSTDADTITFNNVKPGGSCTVYINRASAPTLAGSGLTFNQLPSTTAFASATEMAIYFEASYDGTTIDYYYYER